MCAAAAVRLRPQTGKEADAAVPPGPRPPRAPAPVLAPPAGTAVLAVGQLQVHHAELGRCFEAPLTAALFRLPRLGADTAVLVAAAAPWGILGTRFSLTWPESPIGLCPACLPPPRGRGESPRPFLPPARPPGPTFRKSPTLAGLTQEAGRPGGGKELRRGSQGGCGQAECRRKAPAPRSPLSVCPSSEYGHRSPPVD